MSRPESIHKTTKHPNVLFFSGITKKSSHQVQYVFILRSRNEHIKEYCITIYIVIETWNYPYCDSKLYPCHPTLVLQTGEDVEAYRLTVDLCRCGLCSQLL